MFLNHKWVAIAIEVEFSALRRGLAFEIWIDEYVWNSRHCEQERWECRAARWHDALMHG
jgi:hypothetical protein